MLSPGAVPAVAIGDVTARQAERAEPWTVIGGARGPTLARESN